MIKLFIYSNILWTIFISRIYNLTVKATNMASQSSCQNVIIHVLDMNDNIPKFLQSEYIGSVSESAALGSYVHIFDDKKKR